MREKGEEMVEVRESKGVREEMYKEKGGGKERKKVREKEHEEEMVDGDAEWKGRGEEGRGQRKGRRG